MLPGYSGEVRLNEKGDRIPVLQLRNFQDGKGVLLHTFGQGNLKGKDIKVKWPNGVKVPPKDRPPCGFNNELCPGNYISLAPIRFRFL